MSIDIQNVGPERTEEFLRPISTAFGIRPNPQRLQARSRITEVTRQLGAIEYGQVVGSAGTFALSMTTPGAQVSTAGLTAVAVLPSHRRRGIMSRLVRQHLRDARDDGHAISALWASESQIYGRFGYGMASQVCRIGIERERSAFVNPVDTSSQVRHVDEQQANVLFPSIWERARRGTPGMLSRSPTWWELRRLHDWSESGDVLQRVVVEDEGRAVAYALYRITFKMDDFELPNGTVNVVEAVGDTPSSTRRIWRYLLDIDLMERVQAQLLPVDHVLVHSLVEPRRLRQILTDGVWIRIVDVARALSARTYGADAVLHLGVEDSLFPDNQQCFRIDGGAGEVAASGREPELRMDIATLSAAYLGGFSFSQLHAAGRVQSCTASALQRADRLFYCARAPWCPEIF